MVLALLLPSLSAPDPDHYSFTNAPANCATECNNTGCCCLARLREQCNGTGIADGAIINLASIPVSWTGCAPYYVGHVNENWPGVAQLRLDIVKEDDGCCLRGKPYNCAKESCEIKFQFEYSGTQPDPATTDCAPPVASAGTTNGTAPLDSSTGLFSLITVMPECGNCPDFEFRLKDASGQALTESKTIYADCDPCSIPPQ